MKISIQIECQTGGQILTHLEVMLLQLEEKIQHTKNGRALKKPFEVIDSNIYGDHKMKISKFDFEDLESGFDLHEMDYDKIKNLVL